MAAKRKQEEPIRFYAVIVDQIFSSPVAAHNFAAVTFGKSAKLFTVATITVKRTIEKTEPVRKPASKTAAKARARRAP